MTESFDTAFIISIGDAFIRRADESSTESTFQATTGNRDDAAVFTLTDRVLRSGDWTLSRYTSEDRSLLPKPVYWFREEGLAQEVSLEQEGESWLVESGGAPFVALDGKVFAQLIHQGEGAQAKVVVVSE
ncbi:hypothetical protein BDV26DRAFT_250674 [Aspergillus bertholletiae]|uniref:Uncharacterized protein n=1 Tax=Aspergillus bertholletiae TaxID=1226010 RepID=A0A5N7BQ38_9EURO|nr:hypothetical protein BDV26DRAFT_250674 [Aspergillus bertholletiae]